MEAKDVVVEIRNRDLVRVGMIPTDQLTLELAGKHNKLGDWTVTLPADSELAALLIEPGSGIIATGPHDILMSGPMVSYTRAQSSSDPIGTLTVKGVDDSVVLSDIMAWPDPTKSPELAEKASAAGLILARIQSGASYSEDWTWTDCPDIVTQYNDVLLSQAGAEASTKARSITWLQAFIAAVSPGNDYGKLIPYDVRTGNAESLLYGYVNANCGPGALSFRRKPRLVMGANLGRGLTLTKSARFQKLGEVLEPIGLVSGLGFRVVQRGDVLVFEVFQPGDKTDLIRLDVLNGTLLSQDVTVTAPVSTQIMVGQKEDQAHSFTHGTTVGALISEALWGRRIETWMDKSDSNDTPSELATFVAEQLAVDGLTKIATKLVPMDDDTMVFQEDWNIGDTVAVVSGDTELTSWVSGYILQTSANGTRIGVTLGDPADLDPEAAMVALVRSLGQRLSALERATVISPASA